jgi:hypothetical protein
VFALRTFFAAEVDDSPTSSPFEIAMAVELLGTHVARLETRFTLRVHGITFIRPVPGNRTSLDRVLMHLP